MWVQIPPGATYFLFEKKKSEPSQVVLLYCCLLYMHVPWLSNGVDLTDQLLVRQGHHLLPTLGMGTCTCTLHVTWCGLECVVAYCNTCTCTCRYCMYNVQCMSWYGVQLWYNCHTLSHDCKAFSLSLSLSRQDSSGGWSIWMMSWCKVQPGLALHAVTLYSTTDWIYMCILYIVHCVHCVH